MKKAAVIILCLVMLATGIFVFAGCKESCEASLFKSDLVKSVEKNGNVYTVSLKGKQYVDTLVLEEKADKVTNFGVYGKKDDGSYSLVYRQDRIDRYRVCSLDGIVTDELRIEIFSALGKTKIDSVKAYDSTKERREKPFRVTEYLTTEKGKLQKNENNPDFVGYFDKVTDIICIGEIGMNSAAEIVYGEGKDDFENDVATLRRIKEDMNIAVSVNIQSMTGADNGRNEPEGVKKWINRNIDKIITNMTAFAREFGIDAIDIDWEYPNKKSQWDAYSTLITRLSSALKEEGRFITVAVAHWGVKFSKEACEAIEYVNLMTYDIFDERGEHASHYVTGKSAVEQFLTSTNFKPKQVMLGLSFYGRTVNGSGNAWPDMNWDYNVNGKSLGKWGNYVKDFEYVEDGLTKYCDAYVNGYAMNRDKTTYAIASGLGGVMIFRMCCDAPYSYEYSLHKAIAEAMERVIIKA